MSRRGLLAVAGASVLTACGGEDDKERQRRARAAADLEIVRYLLRLERIAAGFWEGAFTQDVLEDVEGGQELARTLARNERTHVETLETYERRLGDTPSEAPRTDFAAIYSAGTRETLRSGAGLANLAAAGYLGQCNRIQDRNLLASVLAIHTVEGRQAAAVNQVAGARSGIMPHGAFAEPLTMDQVNARLKRYAT